MEQKKHHGWLIIFGVCILAVILAVILLFETEDEQEKTKIGFVLSGSTMENGWNGLHYNGIQEACKELDLELLVRENIEEYTGQCVKAVEELAMEGAQMIILSSYGYSEEAQEIEADYPEIDFYVNSFEYTADNIIPYFVRMYQARYLTGIIAGMTTKSNQIGYVAAMPNNEVNRGISAFTLGVRRVNPDAKVIVAWTGSWDDKAKEQASARALIEKKKVDLLTYHQNQTHVVEVAEEYGIDSIAYHLPYEHGSEHCLTAAVTDWKMVYQEMIRGFLQGKKNRVPYYWLGIDKDAVGLSEYSERISKEVVQEVEKAKEEILGGKDVFSGVLYDCEGTLRCGKEETITDKALLEEFDWFVEGVEFYEE